MQDSQNQVQNPVLAPTVTVPVGGVEGSPVSVGGVEGTTKIEAAVAPEATVEVLPSETEPVISKAEKEAGVEVSSAEKPEIHPEAIAAGVKPSIPEVAGYGNLPTDQTIAAQNFKTGDSGQSNSWRGLIVIKELARKLFVLKPQEVK